MTELDRVGNSDNFNFRGGGLHRFCKSARSAPRQCKEKIILSINCLFVYIKNVTCL